MGEAIYYMKVYCKSEEQAAELLPKLQAFFTEGVKAENYWQENRGEQKTQEDFWKEFEQQFPLVSEYLTASNRALEGDKNNTLAGELDFGDEDAIDRMSAAGKEILYNSMVWHFAKWDPLAAFITKKFEVEKVAWISDEYMDPFELI